jgi:hypothetical protein
MPSEDSLSNWPITDALHGIWNQNWYLVSLGIVKLSFHQHSYTFFETNLNLVYEIWLTQRLIERIHLSAIFTRQALYLCYGLSHAKIPRSSVQAVILIIVLQKCHLGLIVSWVFLQHGIASPSVLSRAPSVHVLHLKWMLPWSLYPAEDSLSWFS